MTDTIKMRCADEPGWPERTFHRQGREEPADYACGECGWMQTSFAGGCAELCMSATWHSQALYLRYAEQALNAGISVPTEPPSFDPAFTTRLEDLLDDPDTVGQSEYRAIHELLTDGTDDLGPGEALTMALSMLEELRSHTDQLAEKIHDSLNVPDAVNTHA